jgi:hypothetical protein
LIDAETDELRGEEAFRRILLWRTGAFESLPPEPSRPRTIFKSHNALLLESAHAFDESQSQNAGAPEEAKQDTLLAQLQNVGGVEFMLAMVPGEETPRVVRGLENPKTMTVWARQNLERFRALGDRLKAGPLESVEGLGPQRHVALASRGDNELCVGWQPSLGVNEIAERMRKVLSLWTC